MATSLMNRAASSSGNQTLNMFRSSFISLRSFSSSSSASVNDAAHSEKSKPSKKKKKKKKNLFEVAQFLPNWGLGHHMAKSHWSSDGRHGKAWGIAYKHGLPAAEAPKKISGVHKRCWRYLPGVEKSIRNAVDSSRPTETELEDGFLQAA
ncbi:hypothetical protein LINPERHAP1_LOCUS25499 [Linum perenne]